MFSRVITVEEPVAMLEFSVGNDGPSTACLPPGLLEEEFPDGLEEFVDRIAKTVEHSHVGHQEKNNHGGGEPTEINRSSKRKARLSHTNAPLQCAPLP
jgi:hypothetical protein